MARVLVIDDEPDVLLLCRLNLEHAGHEVYETLNAEVGLAIACEVDPDVVVPDVMLPVRSGSTCSRRFWPTSRPCRCCW